jgi:hypothetical protein
MTDFPKLSAADLLSLPKTNEAWELLQLPGVPFLNDGGYEVSSSIVMLASGDGFLQRVLPSEEPLTAIELAQVVMSACIDPQEGPFRKPSFLEVNSTISPKELERHLQGTGIRVQQGDVNLVAALYDELMDSLSAPFRQDYLSLYDEASVVDYFRAARRFFRATPWEVLPGHRFLAFRIGQGDWHYASVMGEGGEEFGLATFRDWLTVCRFTTNAALPYFDLPFAEDAGEPPALIAAGESEALSLCELDAASANDAELIAQLHVRPVWQGLYPLVLRFSLEGQLEPRFSPAVYGGLLQVLAERSERARGSRISSIKASVDTPDGLLEVRYPSRGDESEARDDYYRITLDFYESGVELDDPDGRRWRLEAEVPGEAKWHRVALAIQKTAQENGHVFPWLTDLWEADSESLLWRDRAPLKEPSPTVAQLAGLDLVVAGNGASDIPLEFERLERPE